MTDAEEDYMLACLNPGCEESTDSSDDAYCSVECALEHAAIMRSRDHHAKLGADIHALWVQWESEGYPSASDQCAALYESLVKNGYPVR